ncbi:MAG: F0F1 ATP synthase subunit delta [Patescibacteria group bacterium]
MSKILNHTNIAKAIYLTLENKKGEELVNANKLIIKFLTKKNLLNKTKEILKNLEKIIFEKNDILNIKIFSAQKLNEENKKEIIKFLSNKKLSSKGQTLGIQKGLTLGTFTEIRLEEKIDQKLLGGVRLENNHDIIDLTLKNKIQQLEEVFN